MVSAGGEDTDALRSSMLPTLQLQQCLNIQQLLASFKTVIGCFVCDTCGTWDFWRVVENARKSTPIGGKPAYFMRYEPDRSTQLRLERVQIVAGHPPGGVDMPCKTSLMA